MNNSNNDAIDNEISSNGYNNNLNYQNYNNYEINYNTMDNGHYNNYYGGDNENNQKIPNIDNLMGSLSLSENSYQDNDVQTNIPPQNQNISKLPLFPKKMFYIDTASYQSTVSSDSYSDGFSPAVSQTQSPTYYGSTTNAVNSFSNISSNVSSPTFFSVPNNQTELLQLQLGSNFTPGTIQISKPDPPKPPAIISNDDGFVYQVQFKRTSRYYIRLPSYNQEIKLNDYVKVYADRGEDLGQVKSMITPNMFYELKNQHGRFVAKDDENIWELKYISRLASTFEKKQLATKANEENQVYQFANRLVGVYNLQLVIVDVEYQFDRHKLTVMYECNKRVDFREFVRDLFAEYKTRIWMQQVSNSKTNSTGPSPSSVSHGISPMISPAGYVNNGQVKSMMSNNYNLPTQPSNNKQLVNVNYNPNQPNNNKQYTNNNQHAYSNNYGVTYNSQLIQNKNISPSNVPLSFNNQINYSSSNTQTTFNQNSYSNSSNNSPLMNNISYNPQLAYSNNINKFNNVNNVNNNSINGGNQYDVNHIQPSQSNSSNFSNVIKQQFEWM